MRKNLRNAVYAALCVVTSRLDGQTSKREHLEGKGEGMARKGRRKLKKEEGLTIRRTTSLSYHFISLTTYRIVFSVPGFGPLGLRDHDQVRGRSALLLLAHRRHDLQGQGGRSGRRPAARLRNPHRPTLLLNKPVHQGITLKFVSSH